MLLRAVHLEVKRCVFRLHHRPAPKAERPSKLKFTHGNVSMCILNKPYLLFFTSPYIWLSQQHSLRNRNNVAMGGDRVDHGTASQAVIT